jgi:hypothetical protein
MALPAATRAGCTRKAASCATRSKRPASRWRRSSASRRARSSSPRAAPRPSTPPSGAPPARTTRGPRALRRRGALGGARRLGRLAPTEVIPVDAAAASTSMRSRRAWRRRPPAPGAGALPVGQPRGGDVQPVHEIVGCAGTPACRCTSTPPPHAGTSPGPGRSGADLVSLSAHKIGGVPGAGALIIRRGSRFEPLIVGGEQERARRAGLEALPALIAFGAAAAALGADDQRLLHEEADAPGRTDRRLSRRRHWRSRGRGRGTPAPGGAAALTAVPRRARGRGRAGAHRVGPGRRGGALGLRLLVGEH